MKKAFLLCLTLFLILAMLPLALTPAVRADKEDTDFGSSDAENRNSHVPDDAFDGDYAEFKGSDGSVTRVFDNGSVVTTFADGSKEGVDYSGNQHAQSKDGTYSVRGTDGTIATEYSDGRVSLTEPDKDKTTTINPDGSFTESFGRLGVSMDYDADGHLTGAGFTGSSERIPTDEYGDYMDGKVTGPNGAVFEISGNGTDMHLVTPNGTVADHSVKGVTDSKDGSVESMSVTWADGTKSSSTMTTKASRDEHGAYTGKDIRVDGSMEYPNGEKGEYSQSVTYDRDGNPVRSSNNVSKFTLEDGTTLWRDHNSEAWEYRDPETETTIVVNPDGHLTHYTDEAGNVWNVTYDENGEIRSADITYPDGAKMIQNPDGTGSFTLPDGTQYTTDGGGSVWKDGIKVKENGNWLIDINELNARNELKAGGKSEKVTASDIVGTWQIEATFSDMESVIVDMLRGLFDDIFGEGSGDDIVESNLNQETHLSQTAVIEEAGGTLRLTLYSEDVTMVYTGKLSGNTLKLKLQSQSTDEDGDIELSIDKLEFNFLKSPSGIVTMYGSYRIDTPLFKATYSYSGAKR